ncbi:MAG: SpoIIIAH-like family protein [Oscillospiraceae bacterium]|nr:SpoIIIAH-like family protein [Oscillospiraceae bacterium]
MTMGKRQLVLAALVVALGAAVYLNWAFSGETKLPATQAVASGDRQYGQTLMVNASGSAVVSSASSTKSSTQSAVKSAASGSSSGTGKNSAVKTEAEADDAYFSQAKLTRQKARDEAVELLKDVLKDVGKNDAAKKEAVSQAAVIAQNIAREANIENLIEAKGYSECVVSIGKEDCSVIVKTKENSQNDAIVIQDIVSGQTGLSCDKIKIIERQ